MSGFPVLLPEASRNARSVDVAFVSEVAIAGAIFLLLLGLLIAFAVRFRRGTTARRGPMPKLLSREIEIGWTVATAFLAVFIFWFFVGGSPAPVPDTPGQLEIHVLAKQWMWKTQHPDGAREIDALHLPVDTPVRLVMASEDVIHSFYVPAFRLKQDVLPGRSVELGFTPDRIGTFDLFCAEYCGTQHSHMTGRIVVMSAAAYAEWSRHQPHGDTLAQEGEALYSRFGCDVCHSPHAAVHAPRLAGLFGSTVALQSGARIRADESYIRRAIVQPRADIVAGYDPIMPSYATLAKPADMDALIAYIRGLNPAGGGR
jgi:cytochrome c oxidase subunit 2